MISRILVSELIFKKVPLNTGEKFKVAVFFFLLDLQTWDIYLSYIGLSTLSLAHW